MQLENGMSDYIDIDMDDIDYEMLIQQTREWDVNTFDELEKLWELI